MYKVGSNDNNFKYQAGYIEMDVVKKSFTNKTNIVKGITKVKNKPNTSPEINTANPDYFISINNEEREYVPREAQTGQSSQAGKKPLPAVKILVAMGTLALIGSGIAFASTSASVSASETPGEDGTAPLKPEALTGDRNLAGLPDAPKNYDWGYDPLRLDRSYPFRREAEYNIALEMINNYNNPSSKENTHIPRRTLLTNKERKQLRSIDYIINSVGASYNSFNTNIAHYRESLKTSTGSQRNALINDINRYDKAREEIGELQAAIFKITNNTNVSVKYRTKELFTLLDNFCRKYNAMQNNASYIAAIPQNLLNLSHALDNQLKLLEKLLG